MKVLFVNDTSGFHCGSRAACEVIIAGLRGNGHEIVMERSKQVVDHEAVDICDAVLVNGEGTLHGDSPRALRILQLLEVAQSMRKATAICNASWFAMTDAYDQVLRRLDVLSVRETLSRDLLSGRHGAGATLSLDASYFHPARARTPDVPPRIRMTDLYWPELRAFAMPTGGQLAKFDSIFMDRLDWPDMLDAVAGCEALLTGRHHGVYAACRTRTPFVALSGNTPKIEGLIAWSGLDLPLTKDAGRLPGLLAGVRRYREQFRQLFEWMEAQPHWISPF